MSDPLVAWGLKWLDKGIEAGLAASGKKAEKEANKKAAQASVGKWGEGLKKFGAQWLPGFSFNEAEKYMSTLTAEIFMANLSAFGSMKSGFACWLPLAAGCGMKPPSVDDNEAVENWLQVRPREAASALTKAGDLSFRWKIQQTLTKNINSTRTSLASLKQRYDEQFWHCNTLMDPAAVVKALEDKDFMTRGGVHCVFGSVGVLMTLNIMLGGTTRQVHSNDTTGVMQYALLENPCFRAIITDAEKGGEALVCHIEYTKEQMWVQDNSMTFQDSVTIYVHGANKVEARWVVENKELKGIDAVVTFCNELKEEPRPYVDLEVANWIKLRLKEVTNEMMPPARELIKFIELLMSDNSSSEKMAQREKIRQEFSAESCKWEKSCADVLCRLMVFNYKPSKFSSRCTSVVAIGAGPCC